MTRAELATAKAEVRSRSGGWCEIQTDGCAHRATQAHHVIRRSQGGRDTPENLLDVCTPCHDHAHAHVGEAIQRGWIAHAAPLTPVVDRRRNT